jgi:hypothetical protein
VAAKQVRLVVLMSAPYSRITLVHAVALLSLFVGNMATAAEQHAARKHATKQEQPAAPPPPALPPPPPTLEQMPALPPKVKFSNGMLTIVAENSTLADILRAVRTQTGAIVEIPPNATERVVTHLGPGPARDVLVSLLDGSHFNYVMLGSQTRPGMLERIILTSKAGTAPGGAPAVGAAAVQGTPNGATTFPNEDAEQPGIDIAEQPGEDVADTAANEENQQPNVQPPPIKTPEQLLRELQQQQQQLQQQGATPAEGAPQGAPPQK